MQKLSGCEGSKSFRDLIPMTCLMLCWQHARHFLRLVGPIFSSFVDGFIMVWLNPTHTFLAEAMHLDWTERIGHAGRKGKSGVKAAKPGI
jgi:hypothetical protein